MKKLDKKEDLPNNDFEEKDERESRKAYNLAKLTFTEEQKKYIGKGEEIPIEEVEIGDYDWRAELHPEYYEIINGVTVRRKDCIAPKKENEA